MSIFGFPSVVNERAARLVAGWVALVSLLGLLTGWSWLLIVLAVGFWLRVAAGPRLSPIGRLAVRTAPRLGLPKIVPGPPKRFAQAIGAVTTSLGAILVFALGLGPAGTVVFAIMAVFATMESVFAFCVGCQIFALLMRTGVIPESICEACADLSLREA